ncbi:MAG: hypothetical protein ACRDFX_00810 [Chloroflexota bacterium]
MVLLTVMSLSAALACAVAAVVAWLGESERRAKEQRIPVRINDDWR